MNRRKFVRFGLQAVASLFGLCWLGDACAIRHSANSRARLHPPLVDDRYFDYESMLDIGRKYLGMNPVYSCYGDLIHAAHNGGNIDGLADICNRQKTGRTEIAQDYAAGRTEIVDGWVLSVHELELFALQALVDSRQIYS
jgi:hypothetical protein